MREERRLRVLENRVLGRIFGPKRDEVTRKWRKLHNEELNDLYCSPNIVRVINSRRMRLVVHVARMGERRGVFRILVGKPQAVTHSLVFLKIGKIITRNTLRRMELLIRRYCCIYLVVYIIYISLFFYFETC